MPSSNFDLKDPVFDVLGFSLSVQVVTVSNVYAIDLGQTSARQEESAFVVRAAGLSFAGQQACVAGAVLLRAELEAPGRLRVWLRARAPEPIRCTKLLWRGLATPLEIVEAGRTRGASGMGEVFAYPERLPLPLIELRSGGEPLVARFEDRRVREKRFGVAVEQSGECAGQGVLELVHQEEASRLASEQEAPLCVLARGEACQGMEQAQLAFARRVFGLRPFS